MGNIDPALILAGILAVVEIYDIYLNQRGRKLRQNVEKAFRKWRECEIEFYRLARGVWRNPEWQPGSEDSLWIFSGGICAETYLEDKAKAQKAWGDSAETLEKARKAEMAHIGFKGDRQFRAAIYN